MSAAIECLLIGGPADGRRKLVRSHWNAFYQQHTPEEFVHIQVEQKLDMRDNLTATTAATFRTTTYRRWQMSEGTQRFWIYYPAEAKNFSIMATLLDGYRQGGAE